MRLQFLKTDIIDGREFAYVFDMDTGVVYRSEVRTMPTATMPLGAAAEVPRRDTSVPFPVNSSSSSAPAAPGAVRETDPTGEMETPEQRTARISRHRVPPAFLGNIAKMHMDPSLTDGRTDVTPTM